MKKKILSILLFTLAGVLAGCHTNIIDWNDIGGGDDGKGDDDPIALTIHDPSQLDQRIAAESRVCEVAFTVLSAWSTEIPDEDMLRWITLTPRYSEITGEQTLRILADENTTGGERTAQFILRCAGESETITITQSPRRSDGTTPEPYQPDPYTDIVSRIAVRDLLNQTAGAPSFEWRFGFDEQQRRVYRAEYLGLAQGQEFYIDDYNFPDDRTIDHYVYSLDESGVTSTVIRQESAEITVNDYGHIRRQTTRVFDNTNGNPEPTEYQTIYSYSEYRLASAQTDGRNVVYVWSNGNLEQSGMEGEKTEYTYGYNDRRNDRTNIDLNALLCSDVYRAVGLLGKRSRNLLASRTHAKGAQDKFEYTFDADGRVNTITHSLVEAGNTQPVFLYTIYYQTDTGTSK